MKIKLVQIDDVFVLLFRIYRTSGFLKAVLLSPLFFVPKLNLICFVG
jgi:hypothetical protein